MSADAQGSPGNGATAIDEAPRQSAAGGDSPTAIVQVIIEKAKDAFDKLRWPVALGAIALIFIGVNLAVTCLLYYRYGEHGMWETLCYTHQVKVDAQLAAHGVDMKAVGELPPPPQ